MWRRNTKAAMLTGSAYAFKDAGDYKVVFNVATGDNRNFSTDFPVSVGQRADELDVLARTFGFESFDFGRARFCFRQIEKRG